MACEFDSATLDLVIQLQKLEAANLFKGKHLEDEISDGELAAQLFEEELERYKTIQLDNIMSRSIAEAILADAEAIKTSIEEEEDDVRTTAESDTQFEANHGPLDDVPHTNALQALIDDDMLEKLTAMYIGSHAESSAQGEKRGIKSRHCVSCMTDVPYLDALRCPCSHDYCRSCVGELFEAAIQDETLFPARCCGQPIPLGLNRIFLSAEVIERYQAKMLEYGTEDRTYCHRPACSAFISPSSIQGDTATCTICQSITCTICKGPFHEDDCPLDLAALGVLRLANEQGWRRCFSCRSLVELSTGCNHMS